MGNANVPSFAKPSARQARIDTKTQTNPPTPSLRRDRPQMNQPLREAMAGKLQIYADGGVRGER